MKAQSVAFLLCAGLVLGAAVFEVAADDFDGYPDLLPLRPGRRTVTLRSPGYEDLKLRLEIVAGTRIRIRRDMVPLDSE